MPAPDRVKPSRANPIAKPTWSTEWTKEVAPDDSGVTPVAVYVGRGMDAHIANPFVPNHSGSKGDCDEAIMAFIESYYRPDLSVEQIQTTYPKIHVHRHHKGTDGHALVRLIKRFASQANLGVHQSVLPVEGASGAWIVTLTQFPRLGGGRLLPEAR